MKRVHREPEAVVTASGSFTCEPTGAAADGVAPAGMAYDQVCKGYRHARYLEQLQYSL